MKLLLQILQKGKLKDIKSLLDKNVYQQFEDAIKDRECKKAFI